jgi:hypothetical protein
MQLGAVDTKKMGYVPVVESDFDFNSLSKKVNLIEQKQNYMLIGLLLLLILTLTKK